MIACSKGAVWVLFCFLHLTVFHMHSCLTRLAKFLKNVKHVVLFCSWSKKISNFKLWSKRYDNLPYDMVFFIVCFQNTEHLLRWTLCEHGKLHFWHTYFQSKLIFLSIKHNITRLSNYFIEFYLFYWNIKTIIEHEYSG